ncbi:MAG: ACT domain-containing protein [Clostridia bacterium]|nr:ACT domain-containing protein [Clostridia bacterium]
MKKAIVTVVGKDTVGIISSVSGVLSENNVNILDISQTILDGMFTMMMIVDVENIKVGFAQLSDVMSQLGAKIGVDIRIQLEEIFEAMHRI